MITLRPHDARGHANHGWLDTYHTFSFADYYDPAHMGFRALRVINEDFVQAARGFAPHSHQDMEVLTYVLAGALEHQDSLGTTGIIRPGDVQRMTAGTGITHSEMNPSETEPVHLLQIWITPAERGIKPEYEHKQIDVAGQPGKWHLLATPAGTDGALRIHQDARVSAAALAPGDSVSYPLALDRHAWVHIARGTVTLNGTTLHAGSGAAISDETLLTVHALDAAEVLLFDLA